MKRLSRRLTAKAPADALGLFYLLGASKSAALIGASCGRRKFYPPVPSGFEKEGEALACAMQYGFDLIDGDVDGLNARTTV